MPRRSIGLIIFENDRTDKLRALCQLRGPWNWEVDRAESWPGGLQVTCHGKLGVTEDWEIGLAREAKQELGLSLQFEFAELRLLVHKQPTRDGDEEVKTFGLYSGGQNWVESHVRLHPSSGGLMPIYAHQLSEIRNLRASPKETGPPRGVLAMFEDELEALKTGFDIFENK